MGPAKKSERRSLAHQAIESYERALSVNPTLAYVLVSKAQAHELAEEPDLALLAYRKALEVAPFNAYANYSLGCFYRDRGEDQKALELLQKANLYISYGDEGFQINEWEVRQRRGTAQPR